VVEAQLDGLGEHEDEAVGEGGVGLEEGVKVEAAVEALKGEDGLALVFVGAEEAQDGGAGLDAGEEGGFALGGAAEAGLALFFVEVGEGVDAEAGAGGGVGLGDALELLPVGGGVDGQAQAVAADEVGVGLGPKLDAVQQRGQPAEGLGRGRRAGAAGPEGGGQRGEVAGGGWVAFAGAEGGVEGPRDQFDRSTVEGGELERVVRGRVWQEASPTSERSSATTDVTGPWVSAFCWTAAR
jgi:hypothetical protein